MTEPTHRTWQGRRKYECPACAFDSLDEQKLVDHVKRAHPPIHVVDDDTTVDSAEQVADESPTPKRRKGVTDGPSDSNQDDRTGTV